MRKFTFTFLAAILLCVAALSSVFCTDINTLMFVFTMSIVGAIAALILANVPPSKPTY